MFSSYLRLAALSICVLSLSSCRSINRSVSEISSAPLNSDPYCQPAAEKALLCHVRDIAPRYGSTLNAVKNSEFSKVGDIAITIFAGHSGKEPKVELRAQTQEDSLVVFERTSDLYLRNGCLSEVTGAVFFDGFTPRVTLKLLINTLNSDHAAVAEISDFRHSTPLHLSLDLQCERKRL